MVTSRLIHLAHFRGSQSHPVLSVWFLPHIDLSRLREASKGFYGQTAGDPRGRHASASHVLITSVST